MTLTLPLQSWLRVKLEYDRANNRGDYAAINELLTVCGVPTSSRFFNGHSMERRRK
jgi:hypothetical protein